MFTFGCPHILKLWHIGPCRCGERSRTECGSVTFLLLVNMNQSLLLNLCPPVSVTKSDGARLLLFPPQLEIKVTDRTETLF